MQLHDFQKGLIAIGALLSEQCLQRFSKIVSKCFLTEVKIKIRMDL